MGGTIKKRPSVIGTHPKLPLTNTTRGLVRDSEDDSSSIGSGDNVRVGGGGTLLRSAVRQSLRRNSSQNNQNGGNLRSKLSGGASESSPASSINDLSINCSQVHTVQVHHQNINDVFSQQVEEELNCLAEEPEIDLPPPPRFVVFISKNWKIRKKIEKSGEKS